MNKSKSENNICSMTAKKISYKNSLAQPLVEISNILGIDKPKLYLFRDNIYIDGELLEYLSVPDSSFLNISYSIKDYIKVKPKKLFINKFGLLKALTISKSPNKDEIIDKLFEPRNVINEQSDTQSDDLYNSEIIRAHEQVIREHEATIDDLNEQLAEKDEECDNIKQELTKLKNISISLARYVRLTNKDNKNNEIVDKILRNDLLDITPDNKDLVISDGRAARKELNEYIRNCTLKQEPKTRRKKNNIAVYFILYSIDKCATSNDGEYLYRWKITNTLPRLTTALLNEKKYDSFRDFSEAYRLGVVDNKKCENNNIMFIWYQDIALTEEYYRILNGVFELMSLSDINSITRLLEYFSQP